MNDQADPSSIAGLAGEISGLAGDVVLQDPAFWHPDNVYARSDWTWHFASVNHFETVTTLSAELLKLSGLIKWQRPLSEQAADFFACAAPAGAATIFAVLRLTMKGSQVERSVWQARS